MRRILFDRYDIEDQNHDFLMSKTMFQEALKEHIFAEFVRGFDVKPEMKTRFLEQTLHDIEDEVINTFVIKTHEEYLQNRLVRRDVNVIYFPRISVSTRLNQIELYKINLLDAILEYDLDKIFYNVKKKLKSRKCEYSIESNFTRAKLGPLENLVDFSEMKIMVKSSAFFDVVWEIVAVMENDFFRNIELSDFK